MIDRSEQRQFEEAEEFASLSEGDQTWMWLPEDEAAQLRLAFEKEMERLKAA